MAGAQSTVAVVAHQVQGPVPFHASSPHSGLCLPQVGTPQAQASQTLQEVSRSCHCCCPAHSGPACKYVQTCFHTFLIKLVLSGTLEVGRRDYGLLVFISHNTNIHLCTKLFTSCFLLLLPPRAKPSPVPVGAQSSGVRESGFMVCGDGDGWGMAAEGQD